MSVSDTFYGPEYRATVGPVELYAWTANVGHVYRAGVWIGSRNVEVSVTL